MRFNPPSSSLGSLPMLPVLPLLATETGYERDVDRPSIIARAPMRYPRDTLADMESDTQGFTVTNPAAGSLAMVATGGLATTPESGYVRASIFTGGAKTWQSATRDSQRPYKDYPVFNTATVPVPADDQVWYMAIRVPSSVTTVNHRHCYMTVSDSTDETKVARIGILYTSSAWSIYSDSVVGSGTFSINATIANAVVWVAARRVVGSPRTILLYYYTGGGTTPPPISSMTLLATHTNVFNAGTPAARVGWAYETATDTSTAWSFDILHFDDRLALPRPDSRQLLQYTAGLATRPNPALGFRIDQPERVVAEGPCATTLTQARLRTLLAAAENPRTGLDTVSWEWKAERYATGDSPTGGSFAAAGSVVVAGSGTNIRVTVRPAVSNSAWGSIDEGVLRGGWTT